MKKVLSKTFIIVGSIVAALAITVLVLCLVRVKPMSVLDGYTRVEVYNFKSTDRIEIDADTKGDYKATLDKGIKNTSFSVMQGILEGHPSGAFKYKTEVKEGSKDKERVTMRASEIKNVKSTENMYKLTFIFKEARTVKIEKDEITFDRAIVLVADAENEIKTLEIVFYLDARVDNEAVGNEELDSAYYSVSPAVVNARATSLYNAIGDVIYAIKNA